MSTTTTTQRVNPFGILDIVIGNTKVREAADEAKARQRVQADKAARDARAAAARADKAARDAQIVDEHKILSFQEGFSRAIAKSDWFKNLKSTAQQAAARYCTALASSDMVLPSLDPSMASVINDKFAYGVKLAGNTIPEDYFVGQRQDWFPELLKKKEGLDRPEKIVYTQTSSTSQPQLRQAAPVAKVVVDLPPATTQKSKRLRGAQQKVK